ncbi:MULTISPECIES: NUDIX domain-containing protein [unclassified Streptomyces]|uniref:NUDIX hydrolase n=1 Tax=unclassified Streptomyces TaxID=2593676 RepID=UPI000B88591A|nr:MULTISPECIES: NUDIX domain-containing protein [unclassified Streptomyces]MYT12182.1 NUDIX domain-containing protein [Streptomyces sp. SID4951]
MLLYMSNANREGRSMSLHSVSVAGVVVREDGRVLVIKRADNGAWEAPGGVLELDERPEEGACREVLEETGIKVETERLTGVYKNMKRGVVALVFRCRPVGGEERMSDESVDVRWFTREEVDSHMVEAYAVRVLDAIGMSGPHVRAHDGRRLLLAE